MNSKVKARIMQKEGVPFKSCDKPILITGHHDQSRGTYEKVLANVMTQTTIHYKTLYLIFSVSHIEMNYTKVLSKE